MKICIRCVSLFGVNNFYIISGKVEIMLGNKYQNSDNFWHAEFKVIKRRPVYISKQKYLDNI